MSDPAPIDPSWLSTVLSAGKDFLHRKGGDLFMLGISLAGSYYVTMKLMKIISPRPELDDQSIAMVKHMLNQKDRSHIKLNDIEKSFANNIILPNMINVTFEDIGGLDGIKQEIQQMIVLPFIRPDLFTNPLLSIPKGILLHGPPGTGKTMLAKAIAKHSKAVFINFNQAQLFQAYHGESEKVLAALFSLAQKFQPAIIFIDEVDSFFSVRNSRDSELFVRLQCMFLGLIDGLLTGPAEQVMLLACTNRPEALDPAFLRRMQRKICVGLPNLAERTRILRLKLKVEYAEQDFNYEHLASSTESFSGSDLELLCRTAAQSALQRATQSGEVRATRITMEDCERALLVTFPTTDASNPQPNTTNPRPVVNFFMQMPQQQT